MKECLKLQAAGLALLVVAGVLCWVAVGMYDQSFTRFVPVTLHADRAGLQMKPGNRVKIRGVDLGKVESVSADPAGGVTVELALFPDMVDSVPANVTASLEQLTAFGNKTVQLSYPSAPSTETLAEGSVITADHVSTEVNTVFESLAHTLDEFDAAKLNTLLGGMAQTLEGNGERIGQAAERANDYLARFNPNLPALQRDFQAVGGFANLYADVTPELGEILRNATTTAGTLTERQGDLHSALTGLGDLGGSGADFFGLNGEPLSRALSSLRPATSLLDEYSPMLRCTILGYIPLEKASRTEVYTKGGAIFEGSLNNGDKKYVYPDDLPRVGPGDLAGPACHGLPVIRDGEEVLLDRTPDPSSIRSDTQTPRLPETPLVAQLFGSRELGVQPDQPAEDN
jgi:phospholipid/cholesterol/gamma-HCH transport system substrate-binding protein